MRILGHPYRLFADPGMPIYVIDTSKPHHAVKCRSGTVRRHLAIMDCLYSVRSGLLAIPLLFGALFFAGLDLFHPHRGSRPFEPGL
jgi:hypothetical protein